jgi:hypothetical protein
MHARITTIQGDPGRIDAAVQKARDDVLPILKEQQGWKGFTVMADRSSGKLVGISFFDSEDTLRASDEAVAESRNRVADESGASGPQVEFFEVVIDEMA